MVVVISACHFAFRINIPLLLCVFCRPSLKLTAVDSEYVRKGVMDVFMIAEPLAGKRDTVVTEKRTAVDFAHILRHT